MLFPVWPDLDFWFYLAIISSPSWVFSFLAMDFIKKTSELVFIFLILTLTLSWFASNLLLTTFYFSLKGNQETNRFFRGHECTGKTIGFVLGVLGNVGLYYFSEKSVACMLTFLFLAFYCLCALFCIQPYTGFGALEFLLTGSLNPTLHHFGIRSPYSWLDIIACIVIAGIRYRLQPVDPLEQATSDEDAVDLEAGVLPPITHNEDPHHLGARLDNSPSQSDNLLEPAPAGGPTTLKPKERWNAIKLAYFNGSAGRKNQLKNKNKNKIIQGEQQNEQENQNDNGNNNTTDGGENKDGGDKLDVHVIDVLTERFDKGNDKDKDGGDNKQEKKPEKEKSKEIPVTTVMMKLNLHCEGCIRKLRKAVTKTKGFHDMSVDEEENLITVKGAIDMKALAESLKVKLRKPVEIVPPKKDN